MALYCLRLILILAISHMYNAKKRKIPTARKKKVLIVNPSTHTIAQFASICPIDSTATKALVSISGQTTETPKSVNRQAKEKIKQSG